MNTWDVVVVGAGQAGSAAAWDLAAAGQRVLVLARTAGAGKPCAGGVTLKTLNRYRFSIAPLARETVDTLYVSRFPHQESALKAPAPFCVMTERSELDRYCLDQAREQGAVFEQTRGIESVRQDENGVMVTTREGKQYRAGYLVAADGANSKVRHLLGETSWKGAMAIEGHIDRADLKHYPGMTLDFQAIKGGYGWLFPKGDHINVGLYIWKHGLAPTDRKALDQYCLQRLGVKPHKVSGFPLGTWLPQARLQQGRILFAGDAAGCSEALLGEGIYGAVLSGQLVAEALLAGKPEKYRDSLQDWREELVKVKQLSALFYGLLPVSVPILKGTLGETLVDGFSRGYTLGQCKRRWRGATSLA
ncbi:geranylgeranyl reductase family protein [Alcanivorax sp. S6407]|uniref:NAD(P)/FAD-dependent oxidoreductase n=1 Tax=Alcanivorax sp. S6407 TaxID=2926424 RepID=UPI001FF1665A|nr:geranylgeranyl reductase family protein [Alcanivorax sp. S6407]MCK0152365.1 geranylgeranyl reductase family protein [Alcanivorax sp. S6407]